MALRISKALLVIAIALFYTILVLNNITDYLSNYEFVRHVLTMDSTFPRNHLMWRAVSLLAPPVQILPFAIKIANVAQTAKARNRAHGK
ncbi:MAG: DUF2165 family protein [Terriglobales bacterium]